MTNTEAQAIREMARAALKGNGVRIARWREDDISRIGQARIWACGWYAERDPDNMHPVGRRRTENEMEELIASAAKLFADIVKPKRITINFPANLK
jgi:hypothetical protein